MIGNLEGSGADLAIYLCQSKVTSHFWDDTFPGMTMGMLCQNVFEIWFSETAFHTFWGVFVPKYQGST